MTEKGGKVFLSYARSDRDAAQKVGRKLQEAASTFGIPMSRFCQEATGVSN